MSLGGVFADDAVAHAYRSRPPYPEAPPGERTAIPFVLGHLQDQTLRDMWLEGKSPGITPLQRLRNLNLLLAVIGPASELPRVLEELRQMSRGHAAAVRELIARFESQIEEASSVASL